MSLPAALRLPLTFDQAGLAADLARIETRIWTGHFNTGIYRGEWSGLPLRGPAGATHPVLALSSPPGVTAFEDQPVLAECPAFRAVIAALRCPVRSVRLLRLGPGAEIAEHSDHELGIAHGEARLQVPVRTNAEVDFRAEGRRVAMAPGELWYLDASRPHSVANRGRTDRVHLVLDCQADGWLRGLFAQVGATVP